MAGETCDVTVGGDAAGRDEAGDVVDFGCCVREYNTRGSGEESQV